MKKTLIITVSLFLGLGLVFACSCEVAKEGEEAPTLEVEEEETPTTTREDTPTSNATPTPATTPARTWCVDDDKVECPNADSRMIQHAVYLASDGDIIIVYPGTYTEKVYVDKCLTIRSENGLADCIVHAEGKKRWEPIFVVKSSYVNISGFTIKGACQSGGAGILITYDDNCNISNNIISNNTHGILLQHDADNNVITNNTITDSALAGIRVYYSNHTTITNNNVPRTVGSFGETIASIKLENSDANTITNNNVSYVKLENSDANTITNNTIEDWLSLGGHRNTITKNNIGYVNVGSTKNNEIYLNNFFVAPVPGYKATNIWTSPEKINYQYNDSTFTNYLGNYWVDYAGTDADGDGIGDTAYSIPDRYLAGDKDSYPLMEPFENYVIK